MGAEESRLVVGEGREHPVSKYLLLVDIERLMTEDALAQLSRLTCATATGCEREVVEDRQRARTDRYLQLNGADRESVGTKERKLGGQDREFVAAQKSPDWS